MSFGRRVPKEHATAVMDALDAAKIENCVWNALEWLDVSYTGLIDIECCDARQRERFMEVTTEALSKIAETHKA